MKPRVREVIVVEGRYDRNALLQAVDAAVVEVGGFALFNDREKAAYLRRLAEARGVILLTDPDGAGFVLRSHLKGCLLYTSSLCTACTPRCWYPCWLPSSPPWRAPLPLSADKQPA